MPDLASFLRTSARLATRGAVETHAVAHAFRAGALGVDSPRRTRQVLKALDHYGPLGATIPIAAIRHGDRAGLIDELGCLTFGELNWRSDALACALRARGIREGDGIGILCRNHRGFLDIAFAAAKVGARSLFLNTDFAGPQLREVCSREGVALLAHDEEYEELVGETEVGRRLVGWVEDRGDGSAGASGGETIEGLINEYEGKTPPLPSQRPGVVLLTSGTTGTPKGAPRHAGRSLAPLGAMLSKVPFRSGEATHVAAPMFHALGLAQMVITLGVGSTVVARRRFKAEHALATVERQRCTGLTVVPIMLLRIVDLIESEPSRFDTSSLRIVLVAGSQLEAALARRALAALGDKIYNFYGSTEVAWATIATPEDLRAAPGCAGRPPFGTTVRLYDSDVRPLEGPDKTGRIFVGNGFQFEGYTGGGGKEVIDGLMSTGDVGHFDAGGRLFIDGRDDDMIVSGGENLFPNEVEELLATHAAVQEASVIGVDDSEWGQRLAAYIVVRPGHTLSEDDVKEFVKVNLARYKVPRDVRFLDELPRTPTGKVLKRDLRKLHAGVH
jgi:fatty-acyl-CoA synthase